MLKHWTYYYSKALTERLELLCPLTLKWRSSQFLVKFVKNPFQLYKYQVLAFINAPTTRSDKFRICKVLIVKWGPIQFSTKFEKNTSCLWLREIFLLYFLQHYSYKTCKTSTWKIPDTITSKPVWLDARGH